MYKHHEHNVFVSTVFTTNNHLLNAMLNISNKNYERILPLDDPEA